MLPYQPNASGGWKLYLHVTPKARREEVTGVTHDAQGRTYLKLSVTVPPEDGKANKAVCSYVAKACGVAGSKVRMLSGETSRHKCLAVEVDALPEEWAVDSTPAQGSLW